MEYEQLGLFDEEYPQYKIDKPIRLIEAKLIIFRVGRVVGELVLSQGVAGH